MGKVPICHIISKTRTIIEFNEISFKKMNQLVKKSTSFKISVNLMENWYLLINLKYKNLRSKHL